MSKAGGTRDRIIDEALSQAVVLGLQGISVGGLAQALEMSKSGLFAHFRSMEALQVAVVEEAIARFAAAVVRPAEKAQSPRTKLERLVRGHLDWIEGDRRTRGCLFIAAIQEFDDRPGALRDLLVASQRIWRERLKATARAAIEAGELPAKTDVDLLVFQLMGLSLSYQHACKLLHDRQARDVAEHALAQLISPL